VAGLPEQKLDNVPIHLTCEKCKDDNEGYEDLRYRQSLWENFLGVVRNGNLQRPSSVRYQENFNTMLTDVMANHTHLFSDKETSFLGLFPSHNIFMFLNQEVLMISLCFDIQ
jgi:Fanconi-associated nuclease 1